MEGEKKLIKSPHVVENTQTRQYRVEGGLNTNACSTRSSAVNECIYIYAFCSVVSAGNKRDRTSLAAMCGEISGYREILCRGETEERTCLCVEETGTTKGARTCSERIYLLRIQGVSFKFLNKKKKVANGKQCGPTNGGTSASLLPSINYFGNRGIAYRIIAVGAVPPSVRCDGNPATGNGAETENFACRRHPRTCP